MKGRGARGEDPAVVQPKLTLQPMVMCGDGGRSTGANTHIKMFGLSAGTVRGAGAVRDYSHVVQTARFRLGFYRHGEGGLLLSWSGWRCVTAAALKLFAPN